MQIKASFESNLQRDNVFEEGLEDVKERIAQALRDNRKIAGTLKFDSFGLWG